jgi:hypothetical protein
LATGVHLHPSVCHLFSFIFLVIVNMHQPIHEAQIYFVFLSVGNPKTALKGGYLGRKGGSSFASLWVEGWLVWACKCAYDYARAKSDSTLKTIFQFKHKHIVVLQIRKQIISISIKNGG